MVGGRTPVAGAAEPPTPIAGDRPPSDHRPPSLPDRVAHGVRVTKAGGRSVPVLKLDASEGGWGMAVAVIVVVLFVAACAAPFMLPSLSHTRRHDTRHVSSRSERARRRT